MNPDILEQESYNKPNTLAECAECGSAIETEEDCYGESIDRESYCCWDCLKERARLGTYKRDDGGFYATANAYLNPFQSMDSEEITTVHADETNALKRVAELAESAWGVKCYIERG